MNLSPDSEPTIDPESVICNEFTSDDLAGKSVTFKGWWKIEKPERNADIPVEGTGRFLAITRGDGRMKIQIETRWENDEPNTYHRFVMPQGAVGWIRRLPAGSPFDFQVFDPSL